MSVNIHGWLIFLVNVSKYTNPMDAMGNEKRVHV